MENQFPLLGYMPYYSSQILPNHLTFQETVRNLQEEVERQNLQINLLRNQNQRLKKEILQSRQQTEEQKNSLKTEAPSKSRCRKRRYEKPQRTYICDYENCDRAYASTLALNLHIKTKHNGGTKKQRDAYAKLIVKAQLNGEPTPEINFNFPQNYIQTYKANYLKQMKQSSRKNTHEIEE